jgi:transposase-like protein
MAKSGSPTALELVEELEKGHTVEEVARRFEIPQRTVYRWLSKPVCRDLRSRLRAAKVEHTAALLANVATAAVSTLFTLATKANGDKGEMTRFNAAQAILRLKREYYDQVRLVQEVQVLRQELEEQKRGKSSAGLGSAAASTANGRATRNGKSGAGGIKEGPAGDHESGRNGAGPLAEEPAYLNVLKDDAPMLPPIG